MKKVSSVFWAVVASAAIMIVNPGLAQAQVPNQPQGGQCVAVDTAVATLASLCAMPAYAGCPRCAQMRPCLGNGCGGPSAVTPPAPTSTPVDGWATARRECKGESVSEPGESDGACMCSNKHYKPVPVRRSSTIVGSTPTGGKLRRLTEVWFCFPVDRNEDAIKQLTDRMSAFETWKKANEVEIASIPDLRRRVEELEKNLRATWQLALNANTTATRLEQDILAVARAFADMQTEVQRVAQASTKLSLGLGFGMHSRGDAGSLYRGLAQVGFQATIPDTRVILWADATFGYGSADGVNLDGSKGALWTAGGAGGIGTYLDDAGHVQGRLGLRGEQVFVTEGDGEHFRGYGILGVGQLRYDIPRSPVFIAGEVGVGGGKVSYFGGESPISRAHGDSPVQVEGNAVLGISTNLF